MEERELVGTVEHYYTKIGVAIVNLQASLSVGDKISIEGATTNIKQTVDSIQVEHEPVQEAKAGDAIGLHVSDRVRPGDSVFKIVE